MTKASVPATGNIARTALHEVLQSVGLKTEDSGGEVDIAGSDPAVASPHRLATAMAVASAAQGTALAALHRLHSGVGQNVLVDLRDAAHAIHPSRYLQQNGHPIGFDFTYSEPGNGYFRTADDRCCYLVSTRPNLRNGLLQLLDCANEAGNIAKAVARWKGQDLEDACAARGLPVSLVRAPEEWRAHPHSHWLARQPLVSIRQIGSGKPMRKLVGDRPLRDLKVLDMSHILAGPGLTRTLAEQGANVLRLSAPRQTDPINFMLDTGFGKKAAFLELDDPQQRQRGRELARQADVIVQSYSPGSLARRGFSAEEIVRDHPGVVYVTLSCFGAGDGPWSDRVGFDHNAQSTTGISWVEGGRDTPRLPDTTLVADYITAYLGALGTLAALRRRSVDGGSYEVSVSLARTCMWIQDLGLLPRDLPLQQGAPVIRTMDSPFGELQYLAPITQFSRTPAFWDSPPLPLGASRAQW